MKKVLILAAANPKTTQRLRLDQEVREIQETFASKSTRSEWEIYARWVVQLRDLPQAILDTAPQIIHFTGHGAGTAGLGLEDEVGKVRQVSEKVLGCFFELFADQIQCVILNCTDSQNQAQAIAQHIPYVIGVSGTVTDETAILFSTGFYDALGAGKSIKFAYELGCNLMRLEQIPESSIPVLFERAFESVAPQSKAPGIGQKANGKFIPVYRFTLPSDKNSQDRHRFRSQIQALQIANPQWQLLRDYPKSGEAEAFIMVSKDENYVNNRISYLMTRAFSELLARKYNKLGRDYGK
jgi:hypothetical protein